MKRLWLLLVVSMLFGTPLAAQTSACRTLRDIAYREGGDPAALDSLPTSSRTPHPL